MTIHRFEVGRFRCAVVSDHEEGVLSWPWQMYFGPDTGVDDGEVDRALEEEGEVRPHPWIGYNCVAVDTGERRIVIDTGLGREFTGYGERSATLGRLLDGLEEAGMPADSIDTVVFTHLHNDHTRGSVWAGRPTFAGATHVVSEAEARFWESHVDDRTGHRDVPLWARHTLDVTGPTLRRIAFDTEIAPGVRAVSAAGHTPGHMAVELTSEGERLLCLGDTLYDRIQLRRPEWWTRFDVDGAASVSARRRLLDEAADADIPVTVYHLPFPGLGRIRRAGGVYEWVEGI